MPENTILQTLRKHKEELMQKYGLVSIGLFGSYARGEEKQGSDVDILVEYRDTPDLFSLIELEIVLEGYLNRKIDLLEKTSVRNELYDHITGEVIYV